MGILFLEGRLLPVRGGLKKKRCGRAGARPSKRLRDFYRSIGGSGTHAVSRSCGLGNCQTPTVAVSVVSCAFFSS